ncbi:hypothetical protein GCM10010172_69550 [Paractinoplanes ferrugineus]|uniref:Adhesin domain-containing protein n=1 Tax=Paractinoplanes ferrugineus TaxID=113564 RepID=A0A919J066_9ACTN|nr:hypothetical protein [Actinoplanes ferrugineus]GIE12326.1 hypothetical protein Afe05nite_41660 [Actinoplanes ferrugineus]
MAPNPPGDDDPSTAPEPDPAHLETDSSDVFDYAEYVHDDYSRDAVGAPHFQGDRPGAEQYAKGEYPAEHFPVAGPQAQNYPAETPFAGDPQPDFDGVDYDNDYRGSVYDEFAPPGLSMPGLSVPGLSLPGFSEPSDEEVARSGRVRRLRRPLVLAGVALFLVGLVAAILVAPNWGNTDRTEAVGPKGVSRDEVSGAVNGREAALFELVDGAGTVRLRADDLGDDLYRVTTPADSDVTPKVEDSGDALRLLLPAGSKGEPKEVAIVLNRAVRWTLKLDGGSTRTTVDMTGATVEGVDLHGGANRIDLTLPAPAGPVPVRMTGGVDQWSMRLAEATPVRVRVQSGAGAVTLAGATHRGIAPGQSFTANGWQNDGAAGFDIEAVAGMSALTITDG